MKMGTKLGNKCWAGQSTEFCWLGPSPTRGNGTFWTKRSWDKTQRREPIPLLFQWTWQSLSLLYPVQFRNDSVTADSSVWLELYRSYESFRFGLKERFSVFPFTFAHKSSWDITVLMRKPGSNQGVCFSLVSGARPSHQTNVNTHSGHVWGSALDVALELAWGWPQDFNPILTGNRGLGEWGKEELKRKTRWKLTPQHSCFLFWRQDLEVV